MSGLIVLADLRRAAEHSRGSEDDMFCARHIPALINVVEAAQTFRRAVRYVEFADEQVEPWAKEWFALYEALSLFSTDPRIEAAS